VPEVEGGRPRPPPRIGRRTQSRGHRRRPRPPGTTPSGESGNGLDRVADTSVRQAVARAGPSRACLCVPADPTARMGTSALHLKFQVRLEAFASSRFTDDSD
jgi:hypothetical protein